MNFLPTKEDIHKMVKAFVSIHQEDNGKHIRDDIGPNGPDAPFFKKVAALHEMDETLYVPMAVKLAKYVNTQLPAIMHIAGYPPETDWEQALLHLQEAGHMAYIKQEKGKQVLSSWNMKQMQKGEPKFTPHDRVNLLVELIDLGFSQEVAEAMVTKQLDQTLHAIQVAIEHKGIQEQQEKAAKQAAIDVLTIEVTEYEETWFSKNDMRKKWPKKTRRLALNWKKRDPKLYKEMKEEIPFPSFKWDGTRMSIKIDRIVVKQAIAIIKKHGYITTKLWNYLATMKDTVASKPYKKYDATLQEDGVMLKIPYDDATTRAIIKTIHGRKWMHESKEWRIPLSEINHVVKSFNDTHPLIVELVKIDEVNTYLKGRAERIAISGASKLKDKDVVKEMKKKLDKHFPPNKELYPFQYTGVRFAELANGRCLIGDDMGIGKTMQAIAYAALHEELWPVLVVCPANVKYNWVKELSVWMPKAKTYVVKTGKDVIPKSDFTVINYDLVFKHKGALTSMKPELIIFDESHYLKNRKAKRTEACTELAKGVESILCLSGTAITNRPIELFTTLEMVRPAEYEGQFWDYAKTYCGAEHNGWGWDFNGVSNVKDLHNKLRDCMIRRLKKEVMDELPDKVRQFIPVVPSPSDMVQYKKTHASWLQAYRDHKMAGTVPAGFVLNMLTDLRHQCGLLKVASTLEWVMEYQEQSDKPLVIYYHHKDVGKALYELMQKNNNINEKKWRVIEGATPAERRQQYADAFQAGEYDGLLCSTTATKEGITLTAADTTVFIEREWSPAWEEQAEDRINRIGQDSDTVWATYLSVLGTIDEKFDRIVEQKRATIKAVLDGGDVDTRKGIALALLEAMVEAGELPPEMLKDMKESKPKSHEVKT
jgi:SWI/SNF-related matrix-associated actin-dependent regulator 1 of chromatin subfamily A